MTIDGTDYVASWDMIFDSKGVCRDVENDFEFSYSMKNGRLYIGDRQYTLTELTKEKMVLTDYDPIDPGNPMGFIHYLEKAK